MDERTSSEIVRRRHGKESNLADLGCLKGFVVCIYLFICIVFIFLFSVFIFFYKFMSDDPSSRDR